MVDLLMWMFPGLNSTTGLGIALVVIALLGGYLVSPITNLFDFPFDLKKFFGMMLLLGIFLIFGVPYISDFLSTLQGKLVTWGAVTIIITFILLFTGNNDRKQQ